MKTVRKISRYSMKLFAFLVSRIMVRAGLWAAGGDLYCIRRGAFGVISERNLEMGEGGARIFQPIREVIDEVPSRIVHFKKDFFIL